MRLARHWAHRVCHGDPGAPGLTSSRSHVHPLASPKRHQGLHLNPSPILESPEQDLHPHETIVCTGARAVYIIIITTIIIIFNPQWNRLERLSPEMPPLIADLSVPGALSIPI